jgi:NADH:ubiquinone oxidoreductase subunit F (NADH-binding)/NADH:ubiquinone oxidoreductase subunit E
VILVELSRVMREQGWVSDEAAREVARRLGVPLHRVEGLLSFYPYFRRSPPPRVDLAVCRDMSCWLAGGADLAARARRHAAGGVEVREVSCLGVCEHAPAVALNHVSLPASEVDLEKLSEPHGTAHPPPRRGGKSTFRLNAELPPAPPFDAERVIQALCDAGLRGLGGAGFPTAQKWALVRAAPGAPKFVVCNADESEPGTFKDRVVLEEMPELVLEGLWLAARVIGAEKAIIYLRHEYDDARRALERALADPPIPTEIFISPGGYIMGEETALLEALEDRRGEPRNKPPFPGTNGLLDRPTIINNVETLAAAAVIWRRGADWWKAQGKRGAAGLKLIAVSGHVARPGVYEIPLGTTVAELIALAGGVTGELLAFAPGGASSNFLAADKADTPIDFGTLQAAGSMLGSGALVVVARGTDLLALAANVTRFFRNESCGKCVPCRAGSEKAVVLLDDVVAGRRPRADLDALEPLEEAMRLTSICGLGQVALGPALSVKRLG